MGAQSLCWLGFPNPDVVFGVEWVGVYRHIGRLNLRSGAEMSGIELATTEELITELLGRFEHAVFCGMRIPLDETMTIHRRWVGNSFTCAGLAKTVGDSAIQDFEERANRKDKE